MIDATSSMFFSFLFSEPVFALAWLAAVVVALTVHEFSHALMGRLQGDETAESFGRLTLNPLAHIDPLGFFALLLLGFGWAKPVPYAPHRLRNRRWGSALVSAAGPAMNILWALLMAILLRLLPEAILAQSILGIFLLFSIRLNISLALFNLIPLPPLDGSGIAHALLDTPRYRPYQDMLFLYGPRILFALILLSLFGFSVFSFLAVPVNALCTLMTGGFCGF